MVHRLEAEYWGKVDFIYLDIDDPANEAVMAQYGFRSQPTFLLLASDGEVIQQWLGAVSEEDFREALDAYLAANGG